MTTDNIAEVFSRTNDQAKIHDLEQFTLWTDTPGRPGFRSRLVFGERNSAPRITAFFNLEKPLVVPMGMDATTFYRFLKFWEDQVKNAQPGERYEIDNNQNDPSVDRESVKNRDEIPKVVKSTIVLSKDSNGICFIGVTHGENKLAWRILPSSWHHFRKPNGESFSEKESSELQALAMIEGLRLAMARWIARIRRPWEPKANYQKPAAATDLGSDDILF